MGLFGCGTSGKKAIPQPSPSELLKQHKRTLDRTCRELDRERTRIEQQEKKLLMDIKKAAQSNQLATLKIMAKDLVRTRKAIQTMYRMRAQTQAIGLRIQTLKSAQDMTVAMAGVAKVMGQVNAKMNLPALQHIMADFEKNSEIMAMKNELVEEAVDEVIMAGDDDDLLGEGSEESQTEEIVQQVLDEIGLQVSESMAGMAAGGQRKQVIVSKKSLQDSQQAQQDKAFEERLNKLK